MDDQFFSLREMEAFADQMEAPDSDEDEAPVPKRKRAAAPSDANDDGDEDEEDEEDDEDEDDMDDDENVKKLTGIDIYQGQRLSRLPSLVASSRPVPPPPTPTPSRAFIDRAKGWVR